MLVMVGMVISVFMIVFLIVVLLGGVFVDKIGC